MREPKITIEEPGYAPVVCDKPLPCPFCGGDVELAQLAHRISYQREGRSRKSKPVRVAIICSTGTLTSDTFWFRCKQCRCTTGNHFATAQLAAEEWNRRTKDGDK